MEDAEIFARNLFLQKAISARDYDTYRELYQLLVAFLPPPDLVIYLRASVATLVKRIAQRDRNYERTISAQYLTELNQLYEQWVTGFQLCPVLIVPADNLDYVADSLHLDLVTSKVLETLRGRLKFVLIWMDATTGGHLSQAREIFMIIQFSLLGLMD